MTKTLGSAPVCRINLSQIPPQLLLGICEYLPINSLSVLLQAVRNRTDCKTLQRILRLSIAYIKYYKYSDRGYFLNVFQSKMYIKHERQNLLRIVMLQKQQEFQQLSHNFNKVISQVQSIKGLCMRQQIGQKLETLLLNPDLPMPKLTRQTVPSQSNSILQNILIANCTYEIQDQLQELSQELLEQQQQFVISMMGQTQTIHSIYTQPFLITTQNYKNKLIQNNPLNNLVVCILAAVESKLQMMEYQLSTIDDKYEIMVELMGMYGQYVSILSTLHEMFGFVFAQYQELCEEVLFCTSNNKMGILQIGVHMWIIKMKKYHNITNYCYLDLLQEVSNSQTKQFLQQDKYHSIYTNTILNLNTPNNYGLIYGYMKQNNELQQLVASYSEYVIDLSIDSSTVHQNGHSNQNLGQLYIDTHDLIVKQQMDFVQGLFQNLQNQHKPLMKQVIEQRLSSMNNYIKPKTLKQLLQLYYENSFTFPTMQQSITCRDKLIDNHLQSSNIPKMQQSKPFQSAFNSHHGPMHKSSISTLDDSGEELIEYDSGDQEEEDNEPEALAV